MQLTSIKRRKIHEDVAEQVEAEILAGRLENGAELPSERKLMEALNVGRPAIREALLLLQRSGYIETSSSGRHVVTRPTTTNVVEQLSSSARYLLSSKEGEHAFQDARRLFEAAIARNAAEIATDEDVQSLEIALKANKDAIDDLSEFEKTDVAFHLAIAKIGNNPVFPALHAGISEWLSNQRTVSLRVPGVKDQAYESHVEIFDAISSRNPEKAWQAMNRHLKYIIEQFEKGSQYGAG